MTGFWITVLQNGVEIGRGNWAPGFHPRLVDEESIDEATLSEVMGQVPAEAGTWTARAAGVEYEVRLERKDRWS